MKQQSKRIEYLRVNFLETDGSNGIADFYKDFHDETDIRNEFAEKYPELRIVSITEYTKE